MPSGSDPPMISGPENPRKYVRPSSDGFDIAVTVAAPAPPRPITSIAPAASVIGRSKMIVNPVTIDRWIDPSFIVIDCTAGGGSPTSAAAVVDAPDVRGVPAVRVIIAARGRTARELLFEA